MKVLAFAALLAVFPSPGATIMYAVHGTEPHGETYDASITLHGVDTNSMTVTLAGKTPINVKLTDGRPARLDQSIQPAVRALELANAVVDAAQKGEKSVRMPGPPGQTQTLALTTSGNELHASGVIELPPPPGGPGGPPQGGPPQGGPPQGGPPQGGQGGPPQGQAPKVRVQIEVMLAGGSLVKASGSMTPERGQGPHAAWTIVRQ
jgi:hypothetical protein